jgi:HEPN domain-containing protein/predicted nucleotidyltransferase
VRRLHPLAVVLFGSVARDEHGQDLDLLVVVDDAAAKNRETPARLHRCLRRHYSRFSIDPLLASRTSLADALRSGNPFLDMVAKEGRPLFMKDAVREWQLQAAEEARTAEFLLTGAFFKGACYHAQQALEKSLKARLIGKGWTLEKTHSVARLAALARAFKLRLALPEDDIVFMDTIYRGRYPVEAGLLPEGEPTADQAKRAVKIALRHTAAPRGRSTAKARRRKTP